MGANPRSKRGRPRANHGVQAGKRNGPLGGPFLSTMPQNDYSTLTALQLAATAVYSADSAPYRSVAAFRVATRAPA